MALERTLVLVKNDGVSRGLIGEIISRFEKAGFKVVGMKMVWIDGKFSKEHYKAHVGKEFYKPLEQMITQGPLVAMVLEGVEAVSAVRKITGPTDPKSAPPGTIRGDYAHVSYDHSDKSGKALRNLIHASGNAKEAKQEIGLWFSKDELHSYKVDHEGHTH